MSGQNKLQTPSSCFSTMYCLPISVVCLVLVASVLSAPVSDAPTTNKSSEEGSSTEAMIVAPEPNLGLAPGQARSLDVMDKDEGRAAFVEDDYGDDLDVAETIIFRPLFRYRQDSVERRRRVYRNNNSRPYRVSNTRRQSNY